MALIWVDGFTGDEALAPKWRRYVHAQARADDPTVSLTARVEAGIIAAQARSEYDQAVSQATIALSQANPGWQGRTHVLVAGVGAYDDSNIPGLTTSVNGAIAFAEWMLARFQHADRRLGSVEVLLSPGAGQGHWKPSTEAAASLGLAPGDTLPLEKATLDNLQMAFPKLLRRAAAQPDGAAWFYFSGHGVWKATPLILPQDARLPTNTEGSANLIDIRQTGVNLFNIPPRIQCFFIDACQEISSALLQNIDATPGVPLIRPSNARALDDLDQWIYLGSYTGRLAYGPEDEAPFFTQELLSCLEKRGAQGKSPSGSGWMVTTASLRTALQAAGNCRAEVEQKRIKFSMMSPASSTFTANLCQFPGPPEVFVQVWCLPRDKMTAVRLFVQDPGGQRFRPTALPNDWYTTVEPGPCQVGVQFDPTTGLSSSAAPFNADPPLFPISLSVQAASHARGGSSGRQGNP